MVGLSKLIPYFTPKKILVIGDFMLDQYTFGQVDRISPEAPVPVLHVTKETDQPGGAGNVVLNLLHLGAEVFAMGRVGKDREGEILKSILHQAGAHVEGLILEPDHFTITKTRLIADRQQMVRIDHENFLSLTKKEEDGYLKQILKILPEIDLVAISDYQKGFLSSPTFLTAILSEAKKRNIPTLVDPKGKDFSKYSLATLVKPNLKEAYLAANLPFSTPLDEIANVLFEKMNTEYLLITKSSDGMTLFRKKGLFRKDFPVFKKEMVDGTGAGDTALSLLSMVLAHDAQAIEDAIKLANLSAGISIEHVGCYPVKVSDMIEKVLEEFPDNKIIESDDFFAMKDLLSQENFHIFKLDFKQGLSLASFFALRELSSKKIVVYIEKNSRNEEMIQFLASLKEVFFILTQKEIFEKFLKEFPQRSFFELAKNGELIEKEVENLSLSYRD